MKRFKPFTPAYDKKTKRSDYWYNQMYQYARSIKKDIYLKEKYGRMDWSLYNWCSEEELDKLLDLEMMSEAHCMYCNSNSKQYWTHDDSRLIHLCLPCLIWDKFTILLEKLTNIFSPRHRG